jgi:hypothetical protein
MKRLIFVVLLLLFIVPCYAADVELAWDASISPDVAGYAVFSCDYQHGYGSAICEVPGLTCEVTVPDDRQTAFVARAYKWGPYDLDGNRVQIWSGDSNEVVFVPSVTPPQPPQNIIIRILVAILDFFVQSSGLFSS